MKKVQVLRAFHLSDTDKDYAPGDIITVSDEALARIKAINVNMVLVIGEVRKRSKKN